MLYSEKFDLIGEVFELKRATAARYEQSLSKTSLAI